ncbi:H-NS family nucleoid-associated regulatory protein [Pseudorhodoferax sp. Leaf265]|uniref:H-NS histone family protein n=1 Tax=Pseudorhodoferax sp. Leaf265 TaxID=1736315 RepID=UPI0009EAC4F9|nr:H-NS histone family protein [Pseudorhodoferax sp. Leaf265]
MPRIRAQKPGPTFAELQRQIDELTAKAEFVRQQELAGVVERIREAIAVYGLTPDELFGDASKRKVARLKVEKKARKKAGTVRSTGDARKSVPKYRDPASGKTWTGNGKRPAWFVAAVEAGTDPQALAV